VPTSDEFCGQIRLIIRSLSDCADPSCARALHLLARAFPTPPRVLFLALGQPFSCNCVSRERTSTLNVVGAHAQKARQAGGAMLLVHAAVGLRSRPGVSLLLSLVCCWPFLSRRSFTVGGLGAAAWHSCAQPSKITRQPRQCVQAHSRQRRVAPHLGLLSCLIVIFTSHCHLVPVLNVWNISLSFQRVTCETARGLHCPKENCKRCTGSESGENNNILVLGCHNTASSLITSGTHTTGAQYEGSPQNPGDTHAHAHTKTKNTKNKLVGSLKL